MMATPMTTSWVPSDAVYELLHQRGVSRDFADAQLAEFVLYWSERGEATHSWGAKFAKHCVREYERNRALAARALKQPVETRVGADWRPSIRAVHYLLDQGIAMPVIEDCIATFILYWSERGDLSATWSTRFVKHVKHTIMQSGQLSAQMVNKPGIQNTRSRSLLDDLTDHTWAQE